jgi:hypothetical protein
LVATVTTKLIAFSVLAEYTLQPSSHSLRYASKPKSPHERGCNSLFMQKNLLDAWMRWEKNDGIYHIYILLVGSTQTPHFESPNITSYKNKNCMKQFTVFAKFDAFAKVDIFAIFFIFLQRFLNKKVDWHEWHERD